VSRSIKGGGHTYSHQDGGLGEHQTQPPISLESTGLLAACRKRRTRFALPLEALNFLVPALSRGSGRAGTDEQHQCAVTTREYIAGLRQQNVSVSMSLLALKSAIRFTMRASVWRFAAPCVLVISVPIHPIPPCFTAIFSNWM